VSLYEERLQRDLGEIRARLDDVSDRVERGVRDAIRAFASHDLRLANLTILRDRAVNLQVRRVDRLCHEFVVRHVPSAGHLRFVSSVLRMNVALERVGDYAAGICRETVRLSQAPAKALVEDAELIGGRAVRVLSQSLSAFREGNEALARATSDAVHDVDEAFKHGFHDLVGVGECQECPPRDLFAVLTVLRMLKRVADQAENICQHTLFLAVGETKEHKVFRVLFVDERDDCQSQLARAYAEKAFPDAGQYTSAGWSPAPEVPSPVIEFLDRAGYPTQDLQPRPVATRDDKGRHYHIIISLGGDPRPHLDSIPYLTAVLEWDVGPRPQLVAPDATEQLERSLRRISEEMQALMEMLAGPDGG
jgi:phosphate transport system protein